MKTFIFLTITFLFVGCSKMSDAEIMEKAVHFQSWGDWDKSIELYEMLLEKYPKSEQVPEALYALGIIYQTNKNDFKKAIEYYQRIAKEFPAHATSPSAYYSIAVITAKELKDTLTAKQAYEEFLQRYPSAPMVPSAWEELTSLEKKPSAKR